MYKTYKTYKQRLEEIERKHNVRINFRFMLISNILTAILVGVLVYTVQNKILKNKFSLYEPEQKNVVSQVFTENKISGGKISVDVNKDLVNISPVLVGKLMKWLYLWQKVMPELDFSSFNKFEQKRLMIDSSPRYKLSEEEFNLREKLCIFSHQKTKCIDPFFGRVIIISDTKGVSKIKFDVSGMILLINPEDRTFQIIEIYGPSFDYDEAFWVNEEVFILAGSEIKYIDNRPVSYIRIPKISIYNLTEKKVMSYYGFGVEEDNYQNIIKPELVKNLYKRIKK